MLPSAGRLLVSSACLLALASSRPAWGQGGSSLAEALFNDGRALYEQRRFEDACPKFRESDRLEPAVGTKLNLTLCEEGRGKLATAWALFRVVLELLPLEDPRSALAREHRRALERRVPRVTVRLHASAPSDAAVTVDETPLAAASLGTPLPLDPGLHRFVIRAGGHDDATRALSLLEAQSSELELEPGPLVAPATATGRDTPSAATPRADAPARTRSQSRGVFTPLRIVAVSGAGVGVVGLILGAVFAADAASKNQDSADLGCQGRACPPAGKQARLDALAAADRATAFGVLGGALVASGGVLWFLGAPEQVTNASVGIQADRLEARWSGSFQ